MSIEIENPLQGRDGTASSNTNLDTTSLKLKITDLRTFVVDTGGDENFVFVKVYTNQGLVGLGEGTLTAAAEPVVKAIEMFRPFLLGRDPTDIELLWNEMYRGPRYRGGLVMGTAISAIEIALWDILGQALGQPIWKLLGGKARNKVRLYVHRPRQMEERFNCMWQSPVDPKLAVECWLHIREEGWTAAKGPFMTRSGDDTEPSRSVREGIEIMAAVREAVGDDFGICVDIHSRATPVMAAEFCKRAEDLYPLFVEEATQPEDVGELRLLRSRSRVPLATGERLVTKHAFAEICSERLVDYVQPDVIHCGGILEMKKIAALAETFAIQVAPHNPQSEVSTLASLHVCFSSTNAPLLEIGSGMNWFGHDLFCGGGIDIEKGFATPPQRPGLGVTLDDAVAAKHPFDRKDWKINKFPDGSIGNR